MGPFFNGAGGENRTHDPILTKDVRYHYATPATVHLSLKKDGSSRCCLLWRATVGKQEIFKITL